MKYFKHSELTDIYHVSLKTVHNWIDATKQGKVSLKLYQTNNRTYISNTPDNIQILEQLSEKGKKYRNSLHHKVIYPRPSFYEIYSRRQILDIITNLDVHGEIPRQYNYFEKGAQNWDNWLQSLSIDESPNILKGTVELIRSNMASIERLINGGMKINVVDLGVGNAYPVKELLGYLIDKKVLNRYIAIDISPSMLSVAERNIKEWYGDQAHFEGYVRDISFERFDDILVDDMLSRDADKTVNLVLLFGATAVNIRSYANVFNVVYSSMNVNDLLMYTDKADTELSRRYFDFSPTPNSGKLSPNHQYILDLLNIDESLYDVEMGFDTILRMRYVRVRLKSAITIKFNFGSIERMVSLEKQDTILLLRVWHMTPLEVISEFEETGFTLVQSSLTKDRQYFLSISAVETRVKSR